MELQITFIVLGCIIVVALSVLLVFAIYAHNYVFGGRMDKKPNYQYFTPEDTFGIPAEPVTIAMGKETMRGNVYGEGDITVVFCHGYAPGCAAYGTEIATIVKHGFRVVAFDHLGCGNSSAKRIKGFHMGVKCSVAALRYAKSRFGENVALFGHSWGAYSAMCAQKYEPVQAVVAISGFDTPAKMITVGSCDMVGKWAAILKPFIAFVGFFIGGSKSNLSAVKCCNQSTIPNYILYGDKDDVVTEKATAFYGCKGEHVQKTLYKGKRHNPYLTFEAEERLANLNLIAEQVKNLPQDEQKQAFKQLDFMKMCEQEAPIMDAACEFIVKNCK